MTGPSGRDACWRCATCTCASTRLTARLMRSVACRSTSATARRSASSASPGAARAPRSCRSPACCPRTSPPPPARVGYGGTDLLTADERTMRRVRGGGIGVVFQDPLATLNPVVRLRRQLIKGPRQHLDLSRREATDRAVELLAAVGIPDPARRIRQYPNQLSGGMRQRVMIAMALGSDPAAPRRRADHRAGRDRAGADRRLGPAIRDGARHTTVWVTHDLGVIAGLADRVLVMYAGTSSRAARPGIAEAAAPPVHHRPPAVRAAGRHGSPGHAGVDRRQPAVADRSAAGLPVRRPLPPRVRALHARAPAAARRGRRPDSACFLTHEPGAL